MGGCVVSAWVRGVCLCARVRVCVCVAAVVLVLVVVVVVVVVSEWLGVHPLVVTR